MSYDLKPCPFCGGEASKTPDPSHSTGWEVGCFSGKCDIEPHVWAVHLETAVMQWNTRADADRIEQLERENAKFQTRLAEMVATAERYKSEAKGANRKISDAQNLLPASTEAEMKIAHQREELARMNARIEQLEAKLAKAVAALRDCSELPFGHTARFALAELEGEPLGAEFEAVWDANKKELYEP